MTKSCNNTLSKTWIGFIQYFRFVWAMMMNCFCGMVDRRKAFTPYFQPGPLSEILTIANLRHAANRVWTCAESESRLCWMKLCCGDSHGDEPNKGYLSSFNQWNWSLFFFINQDVDHEYSKSKPWIWGWLDCFVVWRHQHIFTLKIDPYKHEQPSYLKETNQKI